MGRAHRLWVVALLSTAVLGGCSEIASIRSGPSGATVYVNGKLAGTTPLEYSVPRSELDDPHEVRLEKEGYQTAQATMRTQLAKGRVTGAIFTLGILCIFRSMDYIQPVFVQLQPVETKDDRDRALGESLRNLRDLHTRGKISDEEYERRKEEMLQNQ